jgi:hypothetical protein
MRGRAFAACLLLAAGFAAAPVAAQEAGDDLLSKIVNVPTPEAYSVDGLRTKPKPRKDETVQGGQALRVAVSGKADNPWTIQASNPIKKPIKAGDNLILAFWARLEKGPDGATTVTLPFNGVQMSGAPYSTVFSAPVEVGPEWKLHEIKGKADKNYDADTLRVSIHLATAKQTVDLGPVFVLNMGPSK